MANNRIQIKRTSVTGRAANTSTLTNPGELALNMTDGIMYSTNGSVIFEVGANVTSQRITNSLTLDNDKPLRFKTTNTSAVSYFVQQNDDNFVFYTTNTSYGARPIWSIYANSDTSALGIGAPVSFTGANVNLGTTRLYANGSSGSNGQVLTSNGTATYWSTVSGGGGGGSVDVNAQYVWTNTHTFQANVAFTGNNISVVSNTGSVMFGGASDTNWRIGRSTGSTTKFYYTNNTLDIIAADSNLEGVAIGKPSGNTYLETGYAGTFTRNPIYVGNGSVNVSINSTSFSGTANNSVYLGGIGGGSYLRSDVNDQFSGAVLQVYNDTGVLGSTTGAANTLQIFQANVNADAFQTFHISGDTAVHFGLDGTTNDLFVGGWSFGANKYKVWHQNNDGASSGLDADLLDGSHASAFQTTAGLSANVATLAANAATYLNGKTESNLNVNNALTANNSSYLNSKTESNLNVNNALTANNSSYLGGTAAASYVQNTDSRTLSGNLTFTANVSLNGLIANGTIGTAGQVLHSDGAKVYWSTDDNSGGTVTSVSSGNGLTGGPITTTGTLSVQAGTDGGLVSNSTGVFVTQGTGTVVNATGVHVNSSYIGTLTANNTSFVGSVSAANVVSNAQLSSNLANYQTTAGLSANVATLTANNTTYLNGQLASYYTNATNITTGTLPYAQIPSNIVNTTSAFTISGVHTYNANIIVGTTAGISANGGFGTAGQVLHSNGTSVYWAVDDNSGGTVTSVSSGNGLTGGPITTTGTLSVQAGTGGGLVSNSTGIFITQGTGTVVNATGVHVNSSYIATLDANNAAFLGGVAAADYQTEAGLSANVLTLTANNTSFVGTVSAANVVSNAQLSGNLANYATLAGATFTGAVVVSNNLTVTGNLTLSGNTVIVGANNLIVQDAVVSLHTPANLSPLTSNDGKNIGLAFHYYDTADKHALLYRDNSTGRLQYHNDGSDPVTNTNPTGNNLGVIQANSFWSGNDSVYATTNSTVYTGTANNTTYLNGQLASYYTNATNITTGTLPYAQIPANIVNTTSAFTISGVHTYNANIVVGTTAGISANGGFGTAGHVLHSNGTSIYWAADDNSGGTVTSIASGNGLTGGPITATGTLSVVAGTDGGLVSNSTGVFVTAGSGLVTNSTGLHVGTGNGTAVDADSIRVVAGTSGGLVSNSTGVYVTQGTGTVVNATGVHVNSTYIGTISSNNASFLGGVAAASYVQNTDSRTLSGNLVISGTSFTPSSNTILLGNSTQRWVLSANTGSFSGAVSGITTLAAGNTTITGFINVSSTSVLTGNVGINTTNTTAYTLNVNGSFAATTKSFVIDHPTKPDMKLRYGSLEGPENGVYVRGKLEGKSIIELPEYWWNLIDQDTITVNLTPYGRSQDIWVQSTCAHFIHLNQQADCFFTIYAERKDVDKLVVEF